MMHFAVVRSPQSLRFSQIQVIPDASQSAKSMRHKRWPVALSMWETLCTFSMDDGGKCGDYDRERMNRGKAVWRKS